MLTKPVDITNVKTYFHLIRPIERKAIAELELDDSREWGMRIIDQLQQRRIHALVSQIIDDLMAEAIVGHCRNQRYIKP